MNAQAKNGRSPLWNAACYGNHTRAAQLVNFSADVDATDSKGQSVLHVAALSGHNQAMGGMPCGWL